jgi:hypothetical protein
MSSFQCHWKDSRQYFRCSSGGSATLNPTVITTLDTMNSSITDPFNIESTHSPSDGTNERTDSTGISHLTSSNPETDSGLEKTDKSTVDEILDSPLF